MILEVYDKFQLLDDFGDLAGEALQVIEILSVVEDDEAEYEVVAENGEQYLVTWDEERETWVGEEVEDGETDNEEDESW